MAGIVRGRGVMESWKRFALFVGIIGGIVLAMWVSFTPLVVVSEVHPAEEQGWLIHGGYFPSDEDRRLAALPPDAYVATITGGELQEVFGVQWQAVVDALRGGQSSAAWRSSGLSLLRPSVFFHVTEAPVRSVTAVVEGNGPREAYLRVVGEGTPALLRLRRQFVSLDDFHLGTGWANAVHPPSRLLFPGRRFAPWIMVAGVVLYFLLPGVRRDADTVCYSRRRLVLSDLLAVAMLGFFFALPMLIPGALQPALHYWPITVVFWLMAAPFAFVLPFTAQYAGWAVNVGDEALMLTTPQGRETIPYSKIVGQRPAALRSPRWLRHLLWVGALINPGPGTAGRAVLLGGVLANGVELELDDGSVRYIWAGDAMGTSTLEHGDLLEAGLDRIPHSGKDSAILQTFGMPLRGPRLAE